MLRIGKACSLAELKGWHDWDKQWNRHGSWIDSVSLLLDQSQPAYRNDKETAPNSIFDGVYHAFLREVRPPPSIAPFVDPSAAWHGTCARVFTVCMAVYDQNGFVVLYDLLDSSVFNGLGGQAAADAAGGAQAATETKPLDKEHLFHCKVHPPPPPSSSRSSAALPFPACGRAH